MQAALPPCTLGVSRDDGQPRDKDRSGHRERGEGNAKGWGETKQSLLKVEQTGGKEVKEQLQRPR